MTKRESRKPGETWIPAGVYPGETRARSDSLRSAGLHKKEIAVEGEP